MSSRPEPPPSSQVTAAPPPDEPGPPEPDHGLYLLDGASPAYEDLVGGGGDRHGLAADPDQPLDARLEAYADLIDSEVGDTTLSRARNIERRCSFRQLFLKFEGGNPTGTQKDRIAFAQTQDALRRGFEAITVATCGNYGAAVALAASLAGLRCIIHIPDGYHTRRMQEIVRCGAEIVFSPGDYETAVLRSREMAERLDIYDANPGGANTLLQLRAYGEIAVEIYDELRDAPAIVAVPVSNGTTLTGIYRGFVSLHRRGKTSRIPRMVASSSTGKNPIVRSFLRNLPHCEDLDPKRVRETLVNEPLINWHSYDGEYALQAIRQSGGWAANASDREMLQHSRLLRQQEGLHALPASAAALVALLDHHRREPLPGDRYVVVLTGRRS